MVLFPPQHIQYNELFLQSSILRHHVNYDNNTTGSSAAPVKDSNSRPMYFNSKCLTNIYINKDMLRKATWIPVDTSNSTFVFSAYYEHAAKHVVLVGLKSSAVRGTCQLWFAHGNGTFVRMEESGLQMH